MFRETKTLMLKGIYGTAHKYTVLQTQGLCPISYQ